MNNDAMMMMTDTIDLNALELEEIATRPENGARQKTLTAAAKALPSRQIRVTDAEGNALRDRMVGEVETQDASAWLATGQWGYLVDGNLFVLGRKDDLIAHGGRKMLRQDIEAFVATIPGLKSQSIRVEASDSALNGPRIIITAEARATDPRDVARIAANIRFAVSKVYPFTPELRLSASANTADTQAAGERPQFARAAAVAATQPKRKSSLSLRVLQTAFQAARALTLAPRLQ